MCESMPSPYDAKGATVAPEAPQTEASARQNIGTLFMSANTPTYSANSENARPRSPAFGENVVPFRRTQLPGHGARQPEIFEDWLDYYAVRSKPADRITDVAPQAVRRQTQFAQSPLVRLLSHVAIPVPPPTVVVTVYVARDTRRLQHEFSQPLAAASGQRFAYSLRRSWLPIPIVTAIPASSSLPNSGREKS